MTQQSSQCKICRRLGVKLFLKGEKCLSPKCPLIRRPYSPGRTKRRRRQVFSEYGKELKTKQKLKTFYHLREKQFKKYIKEILGKKGTTQDLGDLLIKKLETRLDSVVYRLGFTSSRIQARQLVSHNHFLVNQRPVNIPSFNVRKGDIIKIHPHSLKKTVFQNLPLTLKTYQPPSWLELDKKKLEGKVINLPSLEEALPPVEIAPIFEFYSH